MKTQKTLVLTSSLALIVGLNGPVQATELCDGAYTPLPERCAHANAGLSVSVPTLPNSEIVRTAPGMGFNDLGFYEQIQRRVVGNDFEAVTGGASTEIAILGESETLE